MKWKLRAAQIAEMQKRHKGKRYRAPLPNLSVEERGPPTSNRIVPTMGKKFAPVGARQWPVGHSHKQGLEMLTPAMIAGDLSYMGGKKT